MTNRLQHQSSCRTVCGVLVIGAVLVAGGTVLRAQDAPTYTESVLYTFTGGTDGGYPYGGVVGDWLGNLYGTTSIGGDLSVNCGLPGCGVVYKLDAKGKQSLIHAFNGTTDGGAYPFDGTLIRDEPGNLYGTLGGGGGGDCCGVVFKVDPNGNETVLHDFSVVAGPEGDLGGYAPALFRDKAGNLYGTAIFGGDLNAFPTTGCGVVYKIEPATNYWERSSSSKFRVLYAFTGGADGCAPDPFGPLIGDEEGSLYGTTGSTAASGAGTIYKLDLKGKLTVLYTFGSDPNEQNPTGGLVRDEDGNLYGTTTGLGFPNPRGGAVYKLDPSGNFTVLHTFTGGSDGASPYSGVIRDREGNLYGTTFVGGTSTNPLCNENCGVVFKLDKFGNETVIYNFNGAPLDGSHPSDSRLFQDYAGNLYGTTTGGGDLTSSQCASSRGCGVVFKLTRSREGDHRSASWRGALPLDTLDARQSGRSLFPLRRRIPTAIFTRSSHSILRERYLGRHLRRLFSRLEIRTVPPSSPLTPRV